MLGQVDSEHLPTERICDLGKALRLLLAAELTVNKEEYFIGSFAVKRCGDTADIKKFFHNSLVAAEI